ncbi:unnamed protein product [Rotaria sp. Silwood2]|nr:unnamed protein product [Rotaria sp. Silwood2]CAF3284699.1 unnamed protein product [Rotaria sp. Silwood2]CAF4643479.1 unnamed protein product [Rotaria sp. Silwood2]CAF4704745.1 unnamed protein product [Rotaria sp. Silwood2]
MSLIYNFAMFMPYIGILILITANILGEYIQSQDKPTTTLKSTERPKEPCQGDDCQAAPNLVAILVGSLCGIFGIVLIGIFITYFCLRRKYKKTQINHLTRPINFIEQPSLYTVAISTNDSTSKLYGILPSKNDSISSHYYEQIHYNQR